MLPVDGAFKDGFVDDKEVKMSNSAIDLLKSVNVLNRDNGQSFTCDDRLNTISGLLWNSRYRRINSQGLFHMYAKLPLSSLPKEVVVVSTHVDCQLNITGCFTEIVDEDIARGTFDNSLTNAAIVSLMLADTLPENVVVAFTGDEEVNCRGAKDVVRFLDKAGIRASFVVLDVTDMGWTENCSFTVENNFWDDKTAKLVAQEALAINKPWRFVPENVTEIPACIPKQFVIFEEAEPDETWDYDELGRKCFSLCIPVRGEMHSDEGVLVRIHAIYDYIDCLSRVLRAM